MMTLDARNIIKREIARNPVFRVDLNNTITSVTAVRCKGLPGLPIKVLIVSHWILNFYRF
jgi:hypothetical protein